MENNWNKVPETLPPDPEDAWFSPIVWLALSDGSVFPGVCLHNNKTETHNSPVHDWFIEDADGNRIQLDRHINVVAWMPFPKPTHPQKDKENG